MSHHLHPGQKLPFVLIWVTAVASSVVSLLPPLPRSFLSFTEVQVIFLKHKSDCASLAQNSPKASDVRLRASPCDDLQSPEHLTICFPLSDLISCYFPPSLPLLPKWPPHRSSCTCGTFPLQGRRVCSFNDLECTLPRSRCGLLPASFRF